MHASWAIPVRRIGCCRLWLAYDLACSLRLFLRAHPGVSGPRHYAVCPKFPEEHGRARNSGPGSHGAGKRDGMSEGIAVVGLACCYPGANTPDELWENVLAQRRAFRRIPATRLRIEDHYSEDR